MHPLASILARHFRVFSLVLLLVPSLSMAVSSPSSEGQGSPTRGTIVAIDDDARELTLESHAGLRATLHVPESAEILLDGEPAILEDLFAGDRVVGAEFGEVPEGALPRVERLVVSAGPAPEPSRQSPDS